MASASSRAASIALAAVAGAAAGYTIARLTVQQGRARRQDDGEAECRQDEEQGDCKSPDGFLSPGSSTTATSGGKTAAPGGTAIRSGLADLIGNTPMVELKSLSKLTGCRVLAKAEYLNPGGSSKDRVAKQIVLDALQSGALKPGGTIVEGTSGSTGISLALMAAAYGLKCHIFMPDDQAIEKSELLKQLGATVVRVKPVSISNPNHYVNLARRTASTMPGAFFANQFENLSNYKVHFCSTGPEIWDQTSGTVDAFVMGTGTGGTLAGVSAYLKSKKPEVQIFLADPPGSSMFSRVKYGVAYTPQQAESRLRRHRYDTIVEGVGVDRVTDNFALAQVDDAFRVSDKESVEMSRFLLREEGLFVGSSSAMNCVGVLRAAKKLGPGHTIVTILCDSGQRHLTRFWNAEYLATWDLAVTFSDASFVTFDDAAEAS